MCGATVMLLASNVFCQRHHIQSFCCSWAQFLRTCDPDILTGYNIVNFDLPYLLRRAEVLQVSEFPFLGRLVRNRTKIRNTKMSSSAFGTHESKEFTIDGRVIMDMLQIVTREYKLRSDPANPVTYANRDRIRIVDLDGLCAPGSAH